MIQHIEAQFSCDDCGTEFTVKLDPAYIPPTSPTSWSIFDVAEDAIRAGLTYEDATDDLGKIGSVSKSGRHYCNRCTKKHDG